ncbi:MAG: M24 family metallopeptidase, partial [Tepidisphaeraceae bacterium]
MTGISEVQASMLRQGIDAWVIYDFRGSNPIFSLLVPGKHHTTRRAVLLIPGTGAPELLVQGLDANQFVGSEFPRHVYLGWQDFADYLKSKLAGRRRIAMEYVPGGALPVVSIVDAGTIELVRSLGVEVVTSADLIQVCAARWSSAARKNHDVAS